MPIRREALLIEAEEFPGSARDVWKHALLDTNVSIRELARIRIAKLGEFDAADFYRQALAEDRDLLAAFSGLGETGKESDLPLIRKSLQAPLPSRRRAAVRALAQLGGESVVNDLIDCLRDDNPCVVREVRKQLQEWLYGVGGERLFAIVAKDTRQHVRAMAVRIIFETGKWRSLPWLIRSSTHEDRQTADLSQVFIEAWFSPPRCNRVFTRPSKRERQAIDESMSESRQSLSNSFLNKLENWLAQ